MVIEANRLILREIEQGDFEALHSFVSVLENVKYMTFGPNDEAGTKLFIDNCIEKAQIIPQKQYDFAIVLKSTRKLIGSCGIYLNDDLSQGFLGWILHRDYWKQGYMPEVGAELLRFGFESLKLHRIYATCVDENYGSWRVMEKNGMRREGHKIKARKGKPNIDPEWISDYEYAILRDEWEKLQKKND